MSVNICCRVRSILDVFGDALAEISFQVDFLASHQLSFFNHVQTLYNGLNLSSDQFETAS